jgi:hypothetical protein
VIFGFSFPGLFLIILFLLPIHTILEREQILTLTILPVQSRHGKV